MEIFVFFFCYHSKTFQERPTTSRWHLSLPVQEWLKGLRKFFISSFFSGKCPSTGTSRQETFFRLGQASTQGSQMKYLRQVISTETVRPQCNPTQVANDPVNAVLHPYVGQHSSSLHHTSFTGDFWLDYPNPLPPDEYPAFSSGPQYQGRFMIF